MRGYAEIWRNNAMNLVYFRNDISHFFLFLPSLTGET